ncbi:MAG TPA: substrate-binding domain-containing protein [Mucilaginibacter sp.]|nr:substrate-binding domain-containing protein [Mucilaginibacter sp.]
MRNRFTLILLGCILLGVFETCKRGAPAKNSEPATISESEQFVSDESFAPILDEELYVFNSTKPGTKSTITYKSENDVVRLLLNDSARFAFLSRKLSDGEIKALKARNLPVRVTKFAMDAVALIVNEASADTTISVSEIKKMLRGETKTDNSIVFDNPNSSLVRYLKDLAGTAQLEQKNIYALKSNKEVIEYVSKHPKAIGIIGFSWLNDPDTDYAEAAKNVKTVAVKDDNNKEAPNQYFRPTQSTLYLKQYPLMRDLYMVNCISSKNGLGAGFEHFIVSDKGQRIVLRSGLLPFLIPGREIIIHSDKL